MPLTDSFAKLLIRGLLAGLIAGILAGGVAFVLGESRIDAAIAIEESNSAAEAEVHSHDATQAEEPAGHSHDEEEALVSRDGQRFGLFLATSLAGLALGAIFAVVANYARRLTTLSGPLLGLTLATLAGWQSRRCRSSSTPPTHRLSETPKRSPSAPGCGSPQSCWACSRWWPPSSRRRPSQRRSSCRCGSRRRFSPSSWW